MIIPFFIQNRGCPHRCVFCNQQISGDQGPADWTDESFHEKIRAFLASRARKAKPAKEVQIAFYGGNFTGLAAAEQDRLLGLAHCHVEKGAVEGIRISTRPDALHIIDMERLAAFGVKTIELGAQSFVNSVLEASQRGHNAEDVECAVELLKSNGFEVILHLMVGLPGDNRRGFGETIARTIARRPDGVRIHPTLVLTDTPLAEDFRRGRYQPLSLGEAVDLCKEACRRFQKAEITVIRLGLQTTDMMTSPGAVLGGPYHPAFGSLVAEALWLERALTLLDGADVRDKRLIMYVPARQESAFRGNKNRNIELLQKQFQFAALEIKPGDQTFNYSIS
ncbi:MAG: radical SAM protein [Deltaproteobacteria bacterium]|nr:radical SAM protein [Deltaproteobacteria bacterium]